MIKNNNEKEPSPITFCDDYDEQNNNKVFVAIPVNHNDYPFTIRTVGSLSPIKYDYDYKIEKPDFKKIKNNLLETNSKYKLKISDFLNHSVKIGWLWQPLLDLIEAYISFCDQQILNCSVNKINSQQNNIKNEWNSRRYILKEIYDGWLVLMSKTDKIDKPIFKEARTLMFKTAKIIILLTKNGIKNGRLINSQQPLIIAWIAACVGLLSVGNYIHALIKNNQNNYDNEKYSILKNKINYFWNSFSKLVKSNSRHISKQIKTALLEVKHELEILEGEQNFVKSIQKYFSKSNYYQALSVINETNECIKLGLKLIDFKRGAMEFVFV